MDMDHILGLSDNPSTVIHVNRPNSDRPGPRDYSYLQAPKTTHVNLDQLDPRDRQEDKQKNSPGFQNSSHHGYRSDIRKLDTPKAERLICAYFIFWIMNNFVQIMPHPGLFDFLDTITYLGLLLFVYFIIDYCIMCIPQYGQKTFNWIINSCLYSTYSFISLHNFYHTEFSSAFDIG